ncbi:alkaline phosphatase family protein [Jatrophihabitans sp.]|uniref:alkaline phosphatase family protein n=1 Tax=Jatrophihabitans sp. TaxID=1932789 RepID=UPI0030C6A339|nr:phosphoesterase [Jatrophihabitans sp.]
MRRLATALVLVLAGCTSTAHTVSTTSATPAVSSTVPAATSPAVTTPPATATATPSTAPAARSGHVVVVLMENRSYRDIIGDRSAPYLNELARQGLNLTSMFAIRHPSQPNYVALFSGSTRGLTSDVCPQTFGATNLARQLLDAHLSFAGYAEGLPNTANLTCATGRYARKHAPWTNFADLPAQVGQPLTAFPTDYTTLPSVSFVIPNLDHDMHDGTVAQGDTWLRAHLSGYVRWATTHHSQLVVTWDEDDHSESNQIPTFIVGAGIAPTTVTSRLTLYSLLRYLEHRFDLAYLGGAATAATIPA